MSQVDNRQKPPPPRSSSEYDDQQGFCVMRRVQMIRKQCEDNRNRRGTETAAIAVTNGTGGEKLSWLRLFPPPTAAAVFIFQEVAKKDPTKSGPMGALPGPREDQSQPAFSPGRSALGPS